MHNRIKTNNILVQSDISLQNCQSLSRAAGLFVANYCTAHPRARFGKEVKACYLIQTEDSGKTVTCASREKVACCLERAGRGGARPLLLRWGDAERERR